MWKWFLASVAVLVVLVGCGNDKIPTISFPGEGQKFVLEQMTYFDVTLADNDYRNVTIEIKGAEVLPGELTCTNGTNGPGRCYRTVTQQFGGFNQTCVQGRPCILVIIARRGNAADVRTVQIVRQGAQQYTPPKP